MTTETDALTETLILTKLGNVRVRFTTGAHAFVEGQVLTLRRIEYEAHAHIYRWDDGTWNIGTQYRQRRREVDDAHLCDGSVLRHTDDAPLGEHERHPLAEYTRRYENLTVHRLRHGYQDSAVADGATITLGESLVEAVRTALLHNPDMPRQAEMVRTLGAIAEHDADIGALTQHIARLEAAKKRLESHARSLW